jgi:hypothetical protein
MLQIVLGDPWGIYPEAGWCYLSEVKAIHIVKQPNISIEETIESINHEIMHYVFDAIFEDEKERFFVTYGYDIFCFCKDEESAEACIAILRKVADENISNVNFHNTNNPPPADEKDHLEAEIQRGSLSLTRSITGDKSGNFPELFDGIIRVAHVVNCGICFGGSGFPSPIGHCCPKMENFPKWGSLNYPPRLNPPEIYRRVAPVEEMDHLEAEIQRGGI